MAGLCGCRGWGATVFHAPGFPLSRTPLPFGVLSPPRLPRRVLLYFKVGNL